MYLRIRFPVLPALAGAALLALACTEPLEPGRRALRAPQVAAAVGSSIALDQVNSTMGLNGTILLKGFNPTNPHLGDAIIATFFWIVPDGGSTITSVTDRLADGTPVGNAYTPVAFVTLGDVAMATYVATNVQNFPEGSFPSGEKILVVQATLSQSVSDGGILISAWTGVAGVEAQALGAHSSGSGTGTSTTVADPGAIPVNAGALAYAVTMSDGRVGRDPPPGFVNLTTQSDASIVSQGDYAVQASAGTVDPQWTWFFNSPGSPRTWLATVLALNPAPGSLTVTTSTTGSNLDPDGYTVTVDGTTSQPIGINGSVTFPGLAPGNHNVALSGVAANCTVSGGSSQTVTVPSGGTVTAAFSVSCTATTGQTTGQMTGGGKLGDRRDFATFGFEAKPTGGEIQFVQHCPDGVNPASPTCALGTFDFHGRVTAGSFGPVAGAPNCRTWSGSGTVKDKDDPSRNGTYTFTVNAACDNGEPGRGTDFLDITIADHNAAYLTGGNIQRHKGD